tara:strand:+ start:209 stop:487 length:279 start_codon:yes stop_codon:yes gene_type:complete
MIPLIYIGLISLSSGFTISYSVIREILKSKYDLKIVNKKNDTLIKFNNEVKVHFIKSKANLSSKSLSELWYSNQDYIKFKNDYINSKKNYSI